MNWLSFFVAGSIGFASSMIASLGGWGLDNWEYWAILALGLGSYIAGKYVEYTRG